MPTHISNGKGPIIFCYDSINPLPYLINLFLQLADKRSSQSYLSYRLRITLFIKYFKSNIHQDLLDGNSPCWDTALGKIRPCTYQKERPAVCSVIWDCYFWPFLELSHQRHKHFYLIPGIFGQGAASALLSLVWISASVDQKGHNMSASSKPPQQLITALWPECSGGSAPPWQCGFSTQSQDNGPSTAAWLTVYCVICRMSAESSLLRGEGCIVWVEGITDLMPDLWRAAPLKSPLNMMFTYCYGLVTCFVCVLLFDFSERQRRKCFLSCFRRVTGSAFPHSPSSCVANMPHLSICNPALTFCAPSAASPCQSSRTNRASVIYHHQGLQETTAHTRADIHCLFITQQ